MKDVSGAEIIIVFEVPILNGPYPQLIFPSAVVLNGVQVQSAVHQVWQQALTSLPQGLLIGFPTLT